MVENLLSHVSLPRYQLDTWKIQRRCQESFTWENAHWKHSSTHLFSSLWVDHLFLVKVKLAIVILEKTDGAKHKIVIAKSSLCENTRTSSYLDKQLAASMSQQLMESNLHLKRWPLPLDKCILEGKNTKINQSKISEPQKTLWCPLPSLAAGFQLASTYQTVRKLVPNVTANTTTRRV